MVSLNSSVLITLPVAMSAMKILLEEAATTCFEGESHTNEISSGNWIVWTSTGPSGEWFQAVTIPS